MKKRILAFTISIITGAIAGAIVVTLLAKPQMMLENESRYDFETTLTTVEQSTKAAGWTIPTTHDLQKSMEKAGKEVNQVQVFTLCNPEHGVKILAGDEERIYSNMLPCRVSVYTKSDGKTYISRLNVPPITKGMLPIARGAMRDAFHEMEEIISGIIIK